MDVGMKEQIYAEHGWHDVLFVVGSENTQVQRAAVEALTNLVTCEPAMARYAAPPDRAEREPLTLCVRARCRLASPGGDQDIKLFILFAQSDDAATVRAATVSAAHTRPAL